MRSISMMFPGRDIEAWYNINKVRTSNSICASQGEVPLRAGVNTGVLQTGNDLNQVGYLFGVFIVCCDVDQLAQKPEYIETDTIAAESKSRPRPDLSVKMASSQGWYVLWQDLSQLMESLMESKQWRSFALRWFGRARATLFKGVLIFHSALHDTCLFSCHPVSLCWALMWSCPWPQNLHWWHHSCASPPWHLTRNRCVTHLNRWVTESSQTHQ